MPSLSRQPVLAAKVVTAVVLAVISALALALVLHLSGCKTTDVPPAKDPGSIVADLKTCASEPVHNLATHALDDFASALVSANYAGAIASVVTSIIRATYDALKDRAEEAAWQAAKCAVEELKEQATVHLGYGNIDSPTADRERVMNRHASEWLAAH